MFVLKLLFFLSFGHSQVITPPAQIDISIVGDSLAWGFGAFDVNNRPPTCLATAFSTLAINFSVPGYTTAQVEKTIPQALSSQPKLIFISSGGNDALNNSLGVEDYPEEKTLTEMSRIFDTLLASGAVVLYLEINPQLNGSARLPKIAELARKKNVLVVDGMAEMWGKKEWLYDFFHPNDEGYKIMCSRIVDALKGHYPRPSMN